ncbi:MAG: hypothetical protein AAGF92_14995 [Myxococcota bacterium]
MGGKRHKGRPAKGPIEHEVKARPGPFELGPLHKVDPHLLLRNPGDFVGETMLMLALAFNDLRDAAAVLIQALKAGGRHAKGTPAYAAAAGLQWYAVRQMTAISHETLELVKQRKKAFGSPEFRGFATTLPPEVRERWDEIQRAANIQDHNDQDGTPRDFRSWLRAVRNEAVWHYGKTSRVADGYREFFLQNESPTPESAHAMFAFDGDTQKSRFCYADAAVMYVLTQSRLKSSDAEQFIGTFNHTLKHIVCAFIEYRQQESGL